MADKASVLNRVETVSIDTDIKRKGCYASFSFCTG